MRSSKKEGSGPALSSRHRSRRRPADGRESSDHCGVCRPEPAANVSAHQFVGRLPPTDIPYQGDRVHRPANLTQRVLPRPPVLSQTGAENVLRVLAPESTAVVRHRVGASPDLESCAAIHDQRAACRHGSKACGVDVPGTREHQFVRKSCGRMIAYEPGATSSIIKADVWFILYSWVCKKSSFLRKFSLASYANTLHGVLCIPVLILQYVHHSITSLIADLKGS